MGFPLLLLLDKYSKINYTTNRKMLCLQTTSTLP